MDERFVNTLQATIHSLHSDGKMRSSSLPQAGGLLELMRELRAGVNVRRVAF